MEIGVKLDVNKAGRFINEPVTMRAGETENVIKASIFKDNIPFTDFKTATFNTTRIDGSIIANDPATVNGNIVTYSVAPTITNSIGKLKNSYFLLDGKLSTESFEVSILQGVSADGDITDYVPGLVGLQSKWVATSASWDKKLDDITELIQNVSISDELKKAMTSAVEEAKADYMTTFNSSVKALDDLADDLKAKGDTAETNADGSIKKANDAIDTLNGKIANVDGFLTNLQATILDKNSQFTSDQQTSVEKALDDLKDEINITKTSADELSTAVAKIKETVDDVNIPQINADTKEALKTANAAKSAVDDISVGGRNYLLNSIESKEIVGTHSVRQSLKLWQVSSNIKFDVGDWLTFSTDVTVTNHDAGMIYFGLQNPWTTFISRLHLNEGTTHVTKSFKATISSKDFTNMQVLGTVDNSNATYITENGKLEKCNTAGDWTPAPEDKADKSYVDSITTGAPNLIRNTSNPQNVKYWSTPSNGGSLEITHHNFYKNGNETIFGLKNSDVNESIIQSDKIDVEAGETYTAQFVGFQNTPLISMDMYFIGNTYGSTTNINTLLMQSIKLSTSELINKAVTFKIPDNVNEGYLRIDNNGSTTKGTSADLYFTEVKLAKESKASAYSPSPLDYVKTDDTAGWQKSKITSDTGELLNIIQKDGDQDRVLKNATSTNTFFVSSDNEQNETDKVLRGIAIKGADGAGAAIGIDSVSGDTYVKGLIKNTNFATKWNRLLTYSDIQSLETKPNVIPSGTVLYENTELTGNSNVATLDKYRGKQFNLSQPINQHNIESGLIVYIDERVPVKKFSSSDPTLPYNYICLPTAAAYYSTGITNYSNSGQSSMRIFEVSKMNIASIQNNSNTRVSLFRGYFQVVSGGMDNITGIDSSGNPVLGNSALTTDSKNPMQNFLYLQGNLNDNGDIVSLQGDWITNILENGKTIVSDKIIISKIVVA